jgi:hypothetical protein
VGHGPEILHAMAGTWPELKLNPRTHRLPAAPSESVPFPPELCFGTSQEGVLLMRTPRYGLVALALLALTIFAPTTVAHAQAYSVLYDFGTRVGDPINPSWPGVVAQGRDTRASIGVILSRPDDDMPKKQSAQF